MNILRKLFTCISMCLLMLVYASTEAETITGDFIFSIGYNNYQGIYKAKYTYTEGTLSVDSVGGIETTNFQVNYGHVAFNTQNRDLIINGGTTFQDGDMISRIFNIDQNTRAVSSLLETGDVSRIERLDIANNSTVLATGDVRYDITPHAPFAGGDITRFNIEADGSLSNPATITVDGDAKDVQEVITTQTGTYYLSYDARQVDISCRGSQASLGTLTFDTGDVSTANSATTHHLMCTPDYVSTGEYDPYSDTLILSGNNSVIAQVALDGTLVSNIGFNSDLGWYGEQYYGIAVDGAGHAFITDASDGVLLFIDYSSTGRIADPSTVFADVTMKPIFNIPTNISTRKLNLFGVAFTDIRVNSPPVADANGPYLVSVGGEVALDGSSSSDPDGDTLTETWTVDGGTVLGNIFTAGDAPGIYEVTLIVNDGTVDSEPAVTTVVVYDPSGGFVTGGGWIDSPVGAYAAVPSLTGKANFGFVSKYKKGATTPSGQTQFQFSTGDLNFHSDTYEWLIVNQGGTNAQYKGTGTVNGGLPHTGEAYKFMLWANDGDNADPVAADTFRIKIWYEDPGEVIIYDNGFDQTISGGSIVIHTGKGKK